MERISCQEIKAIISDTFWSFKLRAISGSPSLYRVKHMGRNWIDVD
jgi:hypothetical protein